MQRIRNMKSRLWIRQLGRDESGQSLIIIAFAIVTLLAIVGLGVDLGLVYVERVNLARAMDAAALAGAQELPSEEAAQQRALEYLAANDFDTAADHGNETCIETWGAILPGTGNPGDCDGVDAETFIIVDTQTFRDGGWDGDANTANRIQVRATQNVPLTFVRVIGYDQAPIAASSTAENIEDLDIVIVYDRSGSMQEDTRCYGCFSVDASGYPTGTAYPLPCTLPTPTHCQASAPLTYPSGSEDYYIVIEAEHYSRYDLSANYQRDWTEFPKTWWAMQRDPNENAVGPDARGSFMMVGPNSSSANYYETINDIVNPDGTDPDNFWTTPRLEYDFTVPKDGTYYVWIRAQGGLSSGSLYWAYGRESRRQVYVGINGVPQATVHTCYWGPYNDGASSSVRKNADPPTGASGSNGKDCSGLHSYSGWSWSRSPVPLNLYEDELNTLDVWAAGAGFRLDRIVITNVPDTDLDQHDPLEWKIEGVSDSGPMETHGRTDWACMCVEDPRFNPYDPISGQRDDLYDDYQPIRAAKEAAKAFVRRLNPELDQIAYVWYSTGRYTSPYNGQNYDAKIVEELYCIRQGVEGCGEPDSFNTVLASIESTQAGGNTDIADGLWDGIRVLTTGEEPANDGTGFPSKEPSRPHFGRANAAHIIILMTDGQANARPSLPAGYGNCYSDDVWPDVGISAIDRARECVIWFAKQALDNGAVLYTIGLGAQADNELLDYAADLTGGWYYFAPSAAELDAIFENLYERIFLRLTD